MAGPTNADIMRAINEQSRAIGNLEGTVKAIDAKLDINVITITDRLNNHAGRLRKMENGLQWYAGAATVFGGLFGTLIAWLKDRF